MALRGGPGYKGGVAVPAPQCPLCAAPSPHVAYPARLAFPEAPASPLDLRVCGGCGVLFAHPLPSAERLAALYQDEGYFEGDFVSGQYEGGYEASTARYRAKAQSLDARLSAPGRRGRLLEVGAAGGLWLSAMKDLGWEVHGVEVSAALRERARTHQGLSLVPSLEALPEGLRFDAIYMAQTLEHVRDPHQAVSRLAALLAPGGSLVLEVPGTLNTPFFRLLQCLRLALAGLLRPWDRALTGLRLLGPGETLPPYHIYEYSPGSLRALLTRHGLKVLEMSRQVPRPDRFFARGPQDPGRLLMRAMFGGLEAAARMGLGLGGDLHVVAVRDGDILPAP